MEIYKQNPALPGNVVSYQKVHNSYVVPNSSVDRLYTHISTLAGIFSTGTMMDGFKMNGVLYEFDHPVSYNQTFVPAGGGLDKFNNYFGLTGMGMEALSYAAKNSAAYTPKYAYSGMAQAEAAAA